MFGYVNANRKTLNKEEADTYQSYYCGLCQQLRHDAGFKGQMLLNFDMTFLAILLSGLYELDHSSLPYLCPIHPACKKTCFINAAVEYAAALDIVLSYHNLMDDYNDNGSKLKKRLAKAYEDDYQRVAAVYPRQVMAAENYMQKLSAAERSGEKNLDMVAGYTGEMLSELFDWKGDMWSKDLRTMGFYLGKFIYLMDAYEDLKKDEKSGSYNPLSYMHFEDNEEYETFMKQTLNTQMAECAKAFERLPILQEAGILRNILYSGVWTKYEYLRIKRETKNKK